MEIKSYGKINLGLQIISKRDDGFHNIETIFYPIKLSDKLSIRINPSNKDYNSVSIRSNKLYVPSDRSNTCYKVIESFFKEYKISECFIIDIYMSKNIPVGGGLGGGSSNAASVLKYLVRYFKIDIKKDSKKLMDIALSVGSDVPFFLILKPCLATGRGEVLKILKNFKLNYKILLVNPNLHISTKWAYENVKLKPIDKKLSSIEYLKRFDTSDSDIFRNDFEEIVFTKYKELENIKRKLKEMGAVFSSLSGSGATMYGFFEKSSQEKLTKAYKYFKGKDYFVFVS